MAIVEEKCEARRAIFQRVVTFHSVDGTLPTDVEIRAQARPDERLMEVLGNSHLHKIERADPIIDNPSFADAVLAAQTHIAQIQATFDSLTQETKDGIILLRRCGRSDESIAQLLGISSEVIALVR